MRSTPIRFVIPAFLFLSAAGLSAAQVPITGQVVGSGQKPNIAVPDFRATGSAAQYTAAFNDTVRADLEDSGAVKFISKSFYPAQIPQQPSDLIGGAPPPDSSTRSPQGFRLADWNNPPISANYLGIGYGAERDNQFVVFGWPYDATQYENLQGAQAFGKIYTGTLDKDGAIKVAHQYAADILARLGVQTLIGTRIVFVSDRTGHKEIWSMNWDGTDQRALTHYGNLTSFPSVSPDGTRVAFTAWIKEVPQIVMYSLESHRQLPFYNQRASLNCCLSFSPDGKEVIFSSTASGGAAQLYTANINGGGLRRLTSTGSIETEPKINPKTGADLVFVSGRGGNIPQIYHMGIDGADAERLTNGEGEATNPCWSPDGTHIAFAWTRGFAPGNYNIFVMDVASRQTVQLTQNEGRNENPSWGPDGTHIIYARKVGRQSQIWIMLADGTHKKPLTTVGSNEKPVWVRATQ